MARRRRRDPPGGAAVVGGRGVADQGASRGDAGVLVGEHRLDELVLPDGDPALGAGRGVPDRLVQGALGAADRERGDVDAAAGQ